MAVTAYICRVLTVAGLLWGSYRSFKVLKNWDAQKGNALLRLWVVMSFQSLYEQWAEMLVDWLPLYYELKCALLLWLLFPESNAPHVLFDSFVTPAVQFLSFQYDRKLSPTMHNTVIRACHKIERILFLLVVDGLGVRELKKWEHGLREQNSSCLSEMHRRVQNENQG
eukprot:gb/GECG01004059.1/.p1 GENE.gb/GECG01004059.1/~~gb/GECG01004059.1/.p1  ORF type:complete len:168 (+),score=11.61 gb/GECG01004059.1/:1-504(+)